MVRFKPNILCVDNDADTCEMVSLFLEGSGFKVTVAQSVAEGLRLAMKEKFDLYLLDLRFSDGNGIGLCEQIRAFDSTTPVVVCSGDVRQCVQDQASQAGAQHFLKKPVPLTNLYETVARLIGKDASLNGACN